MEKNKPLGEWTLAETKKYCNGRRCTGCTLYDNDKEECVMHGTPNSWKLDKPETATVIHGRKIFEGDIVRHGDTVHLVVF